LALARKITATSPTPVIIKDAVDASAIFSNDAFS